MPRFKITVGYMQYEDVLVEAKDAQEAEQYAKRAITDGLTETDDGSYIYRDVNNEPVLEHEVSILNVEKY